MQLMAFEEPFLMDEMEQIKIFLKGTLQFGTTKDESKSIVLMKLWHNSAIVKFFTFLLSLSLSLYRYISL